jgi:succinylarginine dihydrolase
LTEQELRSVSGNVLFTQNLHDRLKSWIEKHYREQIEPDDLRDPALMDESRRAIQELSEVLQLRW